MKKLLKAGYGYTMHTSVVSMMGDHILTFWGCACPLWWISPTYDMEAIFRNGAFGMKGKPVLAQEDSLEKLEDTLLDKAQREFPDPFKFPNGEDVRLVWASLYGGKK